MFSNIPPNDFAKVMDIVICYCIHDNKILLLRRNKDKTQGHRWTAPGGKIEANETSYDAICREVLEETGLDITKEKIEDIGKFYVRINTIDYTIELFKTFLENMPPDIILSQHEHDKYDWVSIDEAYTFPLIEEGDSCLKVSFTEEIIR
jgi:8-oxo-dGTP diphosphatase